MKLTALLATIAGATTLSAAAQARTVVTVLGTDDIYNAGNPGSQDGTNPSSVDVTGLTAVTFSDATGQVYLNLTSGDNLNPTAAAPRPAPPRTRAPTISRV